MNYLEILFEKFKTQEGIARAIGVSQPAVGYWVNGAFQPSAKKAIQIERVTGIPRAAIRSDIFGNA
jgi:DNA-binding transcriptional regulator YdaS (Cro superfamily)